jgi:hypothetical protein
MMPGEMAHHLAAFPDSEIIMPALLVGHGNPTNAIEVNEFSRGLGPGSGNLSPDPKPFSAIPRIGKRPVCRNQARNKAQQFNLL